MTINRHERGPRILDRTVVGVSLVLLCVLSILRVARPPRPVSASAADSVFSAARAMRHVRQIAQRPHAMGTADHDRVRDYVVGEIIKLSLRPGIQTTTGIGTRYPEAGRVQNILARLPGTDSSRKAVLIMAHYDGVEAGPAASDDGAGCAALLETLRALRSSKQPLKHDIIALFTDGEEAGLLGAAAFVREHPWAKDVAVVLNFEARGTGGRSVMFETGPGNLDAARALRSARDATAGSVYATIYRTLPNDTDLSELAVLRLPALNFAFADGIERYHTSRDDVAHLDRGSLQHHGSQMLTMARTFAGGPLPRPVTSDGVFFDLPVIGLVVYPQGFELPLAIVALLLVAVVIARERRGVVVGIVAAIIALVLSGVLCWVVGMTFHGPAVWSGLSATALVLLSLAVTVACYALVYRWAVVRGLHSGALAVWLVIALFVAVRVPGVGYLFTWPLVFAAAARLITRARALADWVTAVVTLLLLAGFIYGVSVIMLGVTGAGAIALGLVASLIALLLLPVVDVVVGEARWLSAAVLASAGIACYAIVEITIHPSAEHPLRSALVYAENADSADAWLGVPGIPRDAWTREAVRADQRAIVPAWTSNVSEYGSRFSGRRVPRVTLDAPTATIIGDSTHAGLRRIAFLVAAPAGSTVLSMRVRGATVVAATIDGRTVDTTRYRDRNPEWTMEYWAVPDSGAMVSLTIPEASHMDLELTARRPGIPSIPGVTIAPRPAYVVPSQTGDVSVVYKLAHF